MVGQDKKGGLARSRLAQDVDPFLAKAGVSVGFDQRLAPQDLAGSLAHARMLGAAGLISPEESRLLVEGLTQLAQDIKDPTWVWDPDLEDVHMNLEKALTDRIGPVGAKLHTARSRNDQVALDERLYLRQVIGQIGQELWELRSALAQKAQQAGSAPMPGYTHLQRAQPILLAHHLLAYGQVLKRDSARLRDLKARLKEMPLGSGALAGTGLPIKPELVAQELSFPELAANSLDAVSSRDLILEFLAFGAILMTNLSRLAEDMVLWLSTEFGVAELPDSLTTSSSMMPQKKNPDGAELIRGKAGRAIGNLVALLTVVKGLPMAYNRDLQEDKEPFFDTVDTLGLVLPLATKMVEGLRFNLAKLRSMADDPYVAATDLADHLVRRGLPFRVAHQQVGALVAFCVEKNIALRDVEAATLAEFCPEAEANILKELTLEAILAARDKTPGGVAPRQVAARVQEALAEVAEEKNQTLAGESV
ncbi:MAG: argininosuccinate lyase [Deltaproteobacteria bacterium]|jgi:argininosuccinate lyase|nr:argininosuccinate lyase [Deltaproteobacteria bacterium]